MSRLLKNIMLAQTTNSPSAKLILEPTQELNIIKWICADRPDSKGFGRLFAGNGCFRPVFLTNLGIEG